MRLEDFYNMDYRSFLNSLKGYRSKAERESNERMVIMRKLMYASLLPHLKKGIKETDIIQFDFEKSALNAMTEAEFKELEKEIESVKAFWAQQDNKA